MNIRVAGHVKAGYTAYEQALLNLAVASREFENGRLISLDAVEGEMLAEVRGATEALHIAASGMLEKVEALNYRAANDPDVKAVARSVRAIERSRPRLRARKA